MSHSADAVETVLEEAEEGLSVGISKTPEKRFNPMILQMGRPRHREGKTAVRGHSLTWGQMQARIHVTLPNPGSALMSGSGMIV